MEAENKTNRYGRYQCPCCGNYTFSHEVGDTHEICEVCYWEDDGIQLNNPNYKGGSNDVSLNQARDNYKKMGACEALFVKTARKPKEEELPD